MRLILLTLIPLWLLACDQPVTVDDIQQANQECATHCGFKEIKQSFVYCQDGFHFYTPQRNLKTCPVK